MSSRTPFLIGSAGEGLAATRDLPSVPARVAAQAALTEDFRNCRRDSSCIIPPHPFSFLLRMFIRPARTLVRKYRHRSPGVVVRLTSPQLVQINPRLQHLGRLHYLLPRNLVILVRRCAREYAGNSRLGTFSSLVVKIADADA